MTSPSYAPRELMAVVLARELKDGEIGSAGVNALVPTAAMSLARLLHSPNLVNGGERVFNPQPGALFPDAQDSRSLDGGEAIEGYWELFGHWHRGLDFFFYSGLQIDRFGNINLHYVGGTFDKPRFRGPGVPNVSLASTSRRFYLYPASHDPRTLVEAVDFISVPGHLRGPASKRAAGIRGGGPALCVSPLAVLDFDPDTLEMRLKSVHEGISVADVRARTGFPLAAPPQVPTTEPPTTEELTALRAVDPGRLLAGAWPS
jgi:glutaconate CoA-transferase, subunit B